MDKRLFVGGLAYSIDDKRLSEIFSPFGVVESATVVMDRESGRSKGFGFVEMATPEEAAASIAKLNETEIDGRKVVVNIARPKEDRPRGDFGGGRGGFQPRGRGGYGNDRSGGRNSDRRGGGGRNRW
jgi:RNA recognition motif-containing protein